MEFDRLVEMCVGGSGDGPSEGGGDGDAALLERNLAALARRSPQEAALIRQSPARGDLRFIETPEGLSAELGGVSLCSKRRPVSEAQTLVSRIDPEKVACAAVLGFGLGHHCAELIEHLGRCSLVVCYEPDAGLLRAVLSRIDCTEMFLSGRFCLVCDASDTTRLSAVLAGSEALVGMGVEIVVHPPSVGRLGVLGDGFGKNLGDTMRAARTHVVTTLANARVSFRNALMNLDHYTRSAGVTALKGACAGRAAIVVSAGPSLRRNLALLEDPGVRDSFVIIAAQTVLKTLLARGIRPHFVAALDYHEVSRRFYEGLGEEDVRGVRLVVEPKANPAILDAFPGEVLCVGDELLSTVLGEGLGRDMGTIEPGATVAHLSYSIARYLGCDPVVFIGQDLGFSDGQYYAPGAAIHTVWGGEVNAHRTLEMFEWERIVRMRAHLRRKTDVHGRAIYSDEQMSSYLAHFEAVFARDSEAGLTIIDASEGGVRKAHTSVMTLRQAIDAHGHTGRVMVPETDSSRFNDEDLCERVGARLEGLVVDSERIASLSERSVGKLRSMLEQQHHQRRVNALIGEINGIKDEVMGLGAAFKLVQFVNQVGVLNRLKRDRLIDLKRGEPAMERQRLQIERDIANVEWTRDAARAVARSLRQARAAFLGQAPKQTNELDDRDEAEQMIVQDRQSVVVGGDGLSTARGRDRVHALVIADPQMTGLGTARGPAGLGEIMGAGRSVLGLTLARLDCCAQLDGLTIVTPEPERVQSMLGSMSTRLPLAVVGVDPGPLRAHGARVGAARVQSGECWRGSIGMLGVYDEQAHPAQLAAVMHEQGIDAGAIVGGDWAMIDPGLVDETVVRLRRQSSEKRVAFSQAVPGIGTMVVDRGTMDSLGEAVGTGTGRNPRATLATMGALLSYIPAAPQSDPIVKAMCVQIDPALRDAGVRVIADTPARVWAMRQAYASLGDAVDAGALACVGAFVEAYRRAGRVCPRTVVLETCTGRLLGGDWGLWKRRSVELAERPVLSLGDAHRVLGQIRSLRDDVAVVFDGVGDPLMHPDALGLVGLAKEDGAACVELRTDLMREGIEAAALLGSGIDILSVDVLADSPATYAKLTGQDRYEQLYQRLQSIFDARRDDPGCPVHLAARITRCDAVYDEIEAFYDKWLMLTGSAIIDPLPGFVKDQRVAALPIPARRLAQLERSTMRVRCDGVVVDRAGGAIVWQGSVVNAIDEGIGQAYQRMGAAMRASPPEPEPKSMPRAQARAGGDGCAA